MAIARKPGSKPQPEPVDAKADAFIAGAANSQPVAPTSPAPAAPTSAQPSDDSKRKPAMIRFDPVLLARVDAAAKRSGISRSAWVQYQLNKALEDMGL